MGKLSKKIKNILNRSYIRYVVIPIILFFFWLISSFLFVPRQSLTATNEKFNINNTTNFKDGKLLKDEKIGGEFFASHDKLGAVSVHIGLTSNNLDNTDRIIFRIKEKGKSWHYENTYDAGFFNGIEFSPFGFPPIENSKGKTYYFEIQSKYGSQENGMTVHRQNPAFIAKYKYPFKLMVSNPKLRDILIRNAYESFTDKKFISYSSIFILPFIFYLIHGISYSILKIFSRIISRSALLHSIYRKYIVVDGSKYTAGKKFFFITLSVFLFYDVFFINAQIHGLFMMIFIFWIIYFIKYNFKSEIIILTFILFLISNILIFLNLQNQIQKMSIWVFAFLCLSLIRTLIIFINKHD